MWKQHKFGEKKEIYGLIEHGSRECDTLTVFFPGLGQAMSEKNYLFSNLRKVLAESGQTCVQFDYRGHGDSFGELGDYSLQTMIEDGLMVMQDCYIQFRPKTIYLIGNGIGSFVASRLSRLSWKYFSIQAKVICISPPLFQYPKASDLFSKESLAALEQNGAVDSQVLIPGYDYYTLSDFDNSQYEFVTSLGGHMLYLHGQKLSYELIRELDQFDLKEELRTVTDVSVLLGEHDTEGLRLIKSLPNAKVYILNDVKYFYQHPVAMDEVVEKVIKLVKQQTSCLITKPMHTVDQGDK
ncbi:Pimeloyl-ACP methyl ester carboxylesterase [Fictibacillus solisalsi]|uniref:Pimeloyl-ACP methyl ester carboxylesterase n=1 Tax=Fictibacillus solisalsi TaxID=459525 RepID=A0A1H0BRE2_9BACL|nr:alpha/beta hydrolase [Fictibacillus solisalsi]SDN48145.1 Pimeloyl-ACP methyl ester carboxylesterase [Fictibacillus solisalsi]